MKSDNDFQIIAVRLHKGCAKNIKKVLTLDKTYFLCNHYELDSTNPLNLIQSGSLSMIESVLYQKRRDGLPPINITVGAIVGKNGEGKSTLIEIILRVINNYAYNKGFTEYQQSLAPVDGLVATVYYRIGADIYAIFCKDEECHLYKNGNEVKDLQDEMFYTIVINYSLYAYNSRLLDRESAGYGSWIDGLFHKNDEYQTPIVINPMRKMGNIDVNRETTLSRQRLMAMYVKAESRVYRRLSEKQFADGFAYSLEKESKLSTNTICDYFRSVQGEYIAWEAVEKSDGNIDESRLIHMKPGWDACCKCLYDYIPLLNLLSSYANDKHIETNPKNTDFYKYISNYAKIATLSDNKHNEIIEYFKNSYGWINFRQFYRLLIIAIVWDELKKSFVDAAILLDCLTDCAEVLRSRHDNPQSAAWLYLVYKVISIIDTYPDYHQKDVLYMDSYNIFVDSANVDRVRQSIRKVINQIKNDKDYVTFKFHQTKNFIEFTHRVYDESNLLGNKLLGYDYYITYDKIHSGLKITNTMSLSEIMPLLPPPIFQGDIIISDNEKKDKVELQSLSSGEIQRLYSASSVIYHLRNLDDRVTDRGRLAYSRVYLILEEVELYFHPEYQQSYLEYLLNQIEFAGLRNIESIGITMVTHSPFILSDVLPANLCCMTKDLFTQPTHTFGANIADLLKDSFLMDKCFMGAFVYFKIKSLLQYLNDEQNTYGDIWTDELAESFIESINEPLMRQLLTAKYVEKRYGNDMYSMKKWYQDKLNSLQ